MKTIGEWREEIEHDDIIQSFLQGNQGGKVKAALDEYFPKDSRDVFPNTKTMLTTAIICGNAISGSPVLMLIGTTVANSIAEVLGLQSMIDHIEIED